MDRLYWAASLVCYAVYIAWPARWINAIMFLLPLAGNVVHNESYAVFKRRREAGEISI